MSRISACQPKDILLEIGIESWMAHLPAMQKKSIPGQGTLAWPLKDYLNSPY